MAINVYLSIITLNSNGLNAPIKRHMGLNGQQNKPITYAVYKRHAQTEKHTQTKCEGMEKDISSKWTQTKKQKAQAAIVIPEKTGFKTKAIITRDKEEPSNSTSGYLSKETQNTKSKRHTSTFLLQHYLQ